MILDSNTSVMITGASSGIGRSTALLLARKKARLCLVARTGPDLEQVVSEALESGATDAFYAQVDVRDEASVEAATSAALDRFGRIDILINSAGLSLNGEVDGYSLEDWRTVVETNLTGTFLTCRAVLPAMKRQGRGEIINISSGAGRNGIKEMAAYCAAKFGVIGFTEALGLEVRNHNIRVASLLPGSVSTAFASTARGERRGGNRPDRGGYAMLPDEVAGVIASMLEQPDQAWMSEVVLRPLNLELRRSIN
ncbi:MAG: SDR family oxidoreductase [Acidobacteriota bacterium]